MSLPGRTVSWGVVKPVGALYGALTVYHMCFCMFYFIFKYLLPRINCAQGFHYINYLHIIQFDQIYPNCVTLSKPLSLLPFFFNSFFCRFPVLFSCTYILYLRNFHTPSPSPFLLFPPAGSPLPTFYNHVILLYLGLDSSYNQKHVIFLCELGVYPFLPIFLKMW
jgi:hypothetical protein